MNYFHELQMALAGTDPTPLLDFVRGCQGTLWLAGNGGSMSTAQHWACDLSKQAGRRAQALGTNSAVLTAWANDVSYKDALSEELKVLGRLGDAIIVLSCSGTSANICQLLQVAHDMPMPTLLVTSAHYAEHWNVPIIRVPHTHYGIIEDCHLAIGHWLTEALCSR